MPLRQNNYFKPKELETQEVQKELSDLPFCPEAGLQSLTRGALPVLGGKEYPDLRGQVTGQEESKCTGLF